MSDRPVKHPSSLRLRNAAIERWLALRNELNFTADELKMLDDADFLSPRDHHLVNGMKASTS